MNWNELDIRISGLKTHYQNGDFSPRELISHLLEKSAKFEQKNIWIKRLDEAEIETYLSNLEQKNSTSLPLYGIPFAIKDNIDLANVSTTAGCEAFSYTPQHDAFVIKTLIDAGAIPIGKTNMDQFATGLVGTRSPDPWGPCKNAFDDNYISGGSSSGSAVAVALGLASFALGTDTAGSGRVPAAFNNIVGLKATKGLISTSGVVPACRSLDVVSIFSLTADDAGTVFDVACEFDTNDPYARKNAFQNSYRMSGTGEGTVKLAIPYKNHLQFFGDETSEAAFYTAVEKWRAFGASVEEIDFSPFLDAAKLLYEGPWITERYIATKKLIDNAPDTIHPVVRSIIEPGISLSAEAAFNAQYRLQMLKKLTDRIFDHVDLLLTPTAGCNYTISALLDNPVELNSNLGYYTNFMNLLDYSAIALPYGLSDDVPNGFSLVGKAFDDQKLLAWARAWQNANAGRLGNTSLVSTPIKGSSYQNPEFTKVVVCGAHLRGQPLNWQLIERDAHFVRATKSSAFYRLYALSDGKRPGMIRDETNGLAIDVEVWNVPTTHFGSFVSAIPAPLGIGKVELADNSWESGFICDSYGLSGAKDISEFGGWVPYLEHSKTGTTK